MGSWVEQGKGGRAAGQPAARVEPSRHSRVSPDASIEAPMRRSAAILANVTAKEAMS